ncbi:MAG: dTDP-4-dehydrorhamnose reductase [Chitinophagales bacterium]|nr:dTDP-4-dehydrorhamnose reductase [Chitinophagales bacterium]
MKHLLITGAKGQLGNELKLLQQHYPQFNFHLTDRSTLDITNEAAIKHFLDTYSVDYLINCAAYTAVDRAEEEIEKAQLVNVRATSILAQACAARDIPMIHYSTDYVYHNEQNRPFIETDPTSPKSVYARTKLEGEQLALAHHPHTMIIRTSWVYAQQGHNFLNTMLRLGQERDELKVVFDQIGTPTHARDLAQATLEIITQATADEHKRNSMKGIFHYSNEGVCSWYDFALAIFELSGIQCSVYPIESSQYPTAAQRPHFSVLNKNKIKETFSLNIPHWRESLSTCMTSRMKYQQHYQND